MNARMTAAELLAMQGKAKRQDREKPVHLAILELCEWMLPRDTVIHHSPNELNMAGDPKSKAIAIRRALDMGMRPGWPDLEIIHRGRIYLLEIKPPATNGKPAGKLSPEQIETQARLIQAGASVATVYCVEEARTALQDWGLI